MTASDHIIWNPSFQIRMPLSVWYFVTKQQKTPSGRTKLLPQITYCKTTQTISLTDITLILLPDQKNTYELCKLGLSHASWKIHEKVDRSQHFSLRPHARRGSSGRVDHAFPGAIIRHARSFPCVSCPLSMAFLGPEEPAAPLSFWRWPFRRSLLASAWFRYCDSSVKCVRETNHQAEARKSFILFIYILDFLHKV